MSGLHWTEIVGWALMLALILVMVVELLWVLATWLDEHVPIEALLTLACGALVIAAAAGVFAP